jgi:hypothetical protein
MSTMLVQGNVGDWEVAGPGNLLFEAVFCDNTGLWETIHACVDFKKGIVIVDKAMVEAVLLCNIQQWEYP